MSTTKFAYQVHVAHDNGDGYTEAAVTEADAINLALAASLDVNVSNVAITLDGEIIATNLDEIADLDAAA